MGIEPKDYVLNEGIGTKNIKNAKRFRKRVEAEVYIFEKVLPQN
jgi:hypothetical protein